MRASVSMCVCTCVCVCACVCVMKNNSGSIYIVSHSRAYSLAELEPAVYMQLGYIEGQPGYRCGFVVIRKPDSIPDSLRFHTKMSIFRFSKVFKFDKTNN